MWNSSGTIQAVSSGFNLAHGALARPVGGKWMLGLVTMSLFFDALDGGVFRNTAMNQPSIMQSFLVLERARQAASQTGAGAVAAGKATDVKPDGRATRIHEDKETKRRRLESDEYLNAAYGGDILLPGNTLQSHGPCKRPLKRNRDGQVELPCYHALYGKAELSQHINAMANMTQQARTQWVFERLKGEYYADATDSSTPVGAARWHYRLLGREVCHITFCACHGIGQSTVLGMQQRLKAGHSCAHASLEEGRAGSSADVASGFAREDYKAMEVIAWTLVYAEDNGDYMPDREEIVIPLRLLEEEFDEYKAGRDDHAHFSYFCTVRRQAPELSHIRHARTCFNFQKCTTCVNLSAELSSAIATGDATLIAKAKAKRAVHHLEQRGERLAYYANRELGADPTKDR